MKCQFCDNDVREHYMATDEYIINCNNCGEYIISSEAVSDLQGMFDYEPVLKNIKHLISGYIRDINDNGEKRFRIHTDTVKEIALNGNLPKSSMEKLKRLFVKLYKRSNYLYEEILIDTKMYSVGYAVSPEEFINQITALNDLGYIEIIGMGDPIPIKITLSGLQYYESIEKVQSDTKKCFVAMWFSEEMKEIYESTISRAVSDCGYLPLIILIKEHNENITDQIIAEIRESKFVIADFTGNRGGVYFESGFALGLGKKVIWTCKENYFNKAIAKNVVGKKLSNGEEVEISFNEEFRIHFDIDHYNFIIWKNNQDLYTRLVNRIRATIQ